VTTTGDFTFIDLFAGIGGLRQAFESRSVGATCVFTSEWDRFARETYAANFRRDDHPIVGDIRNVSMKDIPDHDLLLAGFPCQPFSLAGVSKKNSLGRKHGFLDETQGTLFFEIAKILRRKKPAVLFLENVPNLRSHDGGRTMETILSVLRKLGYRTVVDIVDARPWVPQGRKRIVIIGFRKSRERLSRTSLSRQFTFDLVSEPRRRSNSPFPEPVMADVLHGREARDLSLGPSVVPSRDPDAAWYTDRSGRVNPKYTISPALWEYLQDYADKHRAAGNGFGFGLVGPSDVARTLSARYYKDGAEILVKQNRGRPPRRLTPRECARLMGFRDSFRIPVSDNQAYKQFGNSVVVPMMAAIARALAPSIVDLANAPTRRG